jgi:hypothetical protein
VLNHLRRAFVSFFRLLFCALTITLNHLRHGGGIARSSRGFFARLGPGAVLFSAMADLAASMPELAKIPAVHLRLAWT